MLELQSEGGERDVFRDRHDGHGGEVAGRVTGVPFAARGVKSQRVTCCEGSPSEKAEVRPVPCDAPAGIGD